MNELVDVDEDLKALDVIIKRLKARLGDLKENALKHKESNDLEDIELYNIAALEYNELCDEVNDYTEMKEELTITYNTLIDQYKEGLE